jgi:dephospho-CoA kinase
VAQSGINAFVVGLTGGIGCGKTTVGKLFEALGAGLVDTDQIAHDLTAAGGAAMSAIRAAFGPSVSGEDGAMDRAVMREMAFRDPAQKAKLEAILHPMIRAEVSRRIEAAFARGAPYVLLAIPLLFETMSYRASVRETLVVDCPVADQIARVQSRSALSATEVAPIIAAQVPRALRLQLADRVVVNVGSVDALKPLVAALHERYAQLAGGS